MARRHQLDPQTATRLAVLDPALAFLPRAVGSLTAEMAAVGGSTTVHDVAWTPGGGCRLAFRVTYRCSVPTFVAVEVSTDGWHRYDYRDDPALPALAGLADPLVVADRLDAVAGEPLRAAYADPVRYRPGSRCVLRYGVPTASHHRVLYVKALRADSFATVAALAPTMAPPDANARLVAEVAALWPDLQVVIAECVAGRSASAVLADPRIPQAERIRLAFRLGDLLARFHAQPTATATRRSAADQVASLADAMAAVRHADPALADRLCAVLDALAAGVYSPRGDSPGADDVPVLSHGAFRPGQVLVADDGDLVVLDTDGVCLDAPARDLGSALAYLRWQGVRERQDRLTLHAAEHALLSGYYHRAAARPEPQSLLWWRAAGLLQVALRRYRRLEVAAWPLVPELADSAEALVTGLRARPARASQDTAGERINLLDLQQVTPLLRHALAASFPAGASPAAQRTLHVDSAEHVSTAARRRSVIRYTIRGLYPDHPDRSVQIRAKVFTEPRRARLLHQHLTALHEGPFRHGPLSVPTPLGLLENRRLVLYRSFDGVPLDLLTKTNADDSADATNAAVVHGVRQAARWLARLHGADLRLPRTFSLDQETGSTAQWASTVGQRHPAVAARARWVADRWVHVARSAELGSDVPIHKDFHPGHVLVGDGVCVVDLDEARQGDPAFDLAHFGAYLELTAGNGSTAGSLGRVFLDEYVALTGWVDKGTYAAFGAYTWLKIAKQHAVGSGPCKDRALAQRLSGIERALSRAETCLNA